MPDTAGRVVVNERTGTVVIGQAVRIATVAVAHGNLSVTISTQRSCTTPSLFSWRNGCAETTYLEVEEEEAPLTLLGAATIEDLVNVLNAVVQLPGYYRCIAKRLEAWHCLVCSWRLSKVVYDMLRATRKEGKLGHLET